MLKEVNSIIETIYGCALDNSDWKETLQKCARLIDVAAVAVVPFDPNLKQLLLTSLNKKEHDETSYDYFYRTDPYCKLDPYNKIFRTTGNVIGDFPDTNFISEQEIKNSQFYHEFLKKYEWGRVNVFIDKEPFISGIKISTQRYNGQRNETDNENRFRNIISRHICQALSFSSLYGSMIAEKSYNIYDDMDFGVALLRHDKKILMMNPLFKSLIGDALTYTGGELSSSNQKNKHQITKLLNKISYEEDDAQTVGFAVISNRNQQKILLKAMKIPQMRIKDPLLSGSFILLLAKNLEPSLPDVSSVMQELGLTKSESRLACVVGSGLPPRKAAEMIGISEHYARTMLKEIFYKLNVNSQSQLAALIGKISSFGRFSD